MHILWVVIIGALAGFVAKLISPSPNNPQGFILTTVLGIVGSIVASYLGQAVGLYGPDQSAGFIGPRKTIDLKSRRTPRHSLRLAGSPYEPEETAREWLCTQSAANSSLASLFFRERAGNCVGQIWLGAAGGHQNASI